MTDLLLNSAMSLTNPAPEGRGAAGIVFLQECLVTAMSHAGMSGGGRLGTPPPHGMTVRWSRTRWPRMKYRWKPPGAGGTARRPRCTRTAGSWRSSRQRSWMDTKSYTHTCCASNSASARTPRSPWHRGARSSTHHQSRSGRRLCPVRW